MVLLKWHPDQKMEISLSHEHFDSDHIDLLMWPERKGTRHGTADGRRLQQEPRWATETQAQGAWGHGGGDTRVVGGLRATPGSGFLLAGTA